MPEGLGSWCTTSVSRCAGSMRREDLGMPEGVGSQCMTACSRDGCVVEVVPVPEKDWCVLAAAQGAMRRDHLTAPLSWAEHGRLRHWTGGAKQGERCLLEPSALTSVWTPRDKSVEMPGITTNRGGLAELAGRLQCSLMRDLLSQMRWLQCQFEAPFY